MLVPRETPLNDVHLENMLGLSRMGATVLPPVPAFYNQPASLADMIDHLVVRILDQFGISAPAARRWSGPPPPAATRRTTTEEFPCRWCRCRSAKAARPRTSER